MFGLGLCRQARGDARVARVTCKYVRVCCFMLGCTWYQGVVQYTKVWWRVCSTYYVPGWHAGARPSTCRFCCCSQEYSCHPCSHQDWYQHGCWCWKSSQCIYKPTNCHVEPCHARRISRCTHKASHGILEPTGKVPRAWGLADHCDGKKRKWRDKKLLSILGIAGRWKTFGWTVADRKRQRSCAHQPPFF